MTSGLSIDELIHVEDYEVTDTGLYAVSLIIHASNTGAGP